MKTAFAITVLILGSAATSAAAVEEADQSAKVLAEQVCAVCHGPGGHSTDSSAPNLAAQSRPYLVVKMRQFRNRSLGKPESHIDILGLTLIDDPMADALARYYAEQPPSHAVASEPELMAAGEKLFARGVPEQKLAPCGACHGPAGAGLWIFPRLAGQHAAYIERQLTLIQQQLRDSPVMHGIIKTMTPEDIKAVAAFVQSK